MRKQPTQARSQAMVERILDAAGKVLQAQGMSGFGTRQVAEGAGISSGSLYQYFGNKREILDALQERLTTRLMDMLKDRLPNLAGHDAGQAVRIILNGACEVLDENEGRYLALVQHWQRTDMRRSIQRIETMIFAAVGLLASTHPDLRRLRELPLALYMFINSAIFNVVRYSSEPSEYFSREQLIDGLAEMFNAYVESQLPQQLRVKPP